MKEVTEHSAEKNGDVFSDEEMRTYASLLKDAYPEPRGNIKDSVMAQIRRNSYAEIKINKKLKTRRLIVRYGSLAACLAVITLAGINILPRLADSTSSDSASVAVVSDDAALTEEAYAAVTADTAAEAAAETTAATTQEDADSADKGRAILKNYSLSMFVPVHGSAVIEDEEETAVPQTDDIPEDDKTVSNDGTEELLAGAYADEDGVYYGAVIESSLMASSFGGNYVYVPTKNCAHSSVFRNSYHDIPKKLISIVGEDEFNAWAFSLTEDGDCAVNMVSFYRYFTEADDTFAEEFRNFAEGDGAYYCDIPDVSLFEEGKWDEIEAYYNNGGNPEESIDDYFEYRFKTALITEIGVSSYTKWLAENGMNNISDWAISDLAGAFDISLDRLGEIYDSEKAEFKSEYADCTLFAYDFDKIITDSETGVIYGGEKDAEYRIY